MFKQKVNLKRLENKHQKKNNFNLTLRGEINLTTL